MNRKVLIEQHFIQKEFYDERNEERDYKKYGLYIYSTNLKSNISPRIYVSGNTFFELLKNFSGISHSEGLDQFHVMELIKLKVLNYTRNLDYFYSEANQYELHYNDRLEINFEKWAKLLIKDLYNYNIISPFKYYEFIWSIGVGVMPFYFRGQSVFLALKSFAHNHRRVASHTERRNINYKTFINDFYNFSSKFLGLNADPDGLSSNDRLLYNTNRFLNESGFFQETTPKNVFSNGYYKRRELIV